VGKISNDPSIDLSVHRSTDHPKLQPTAIHFGLQFSLLYAVQLYLHYGSGHEHDVHFT